MPDTKKFSLDIFTEKFAVNHVSCNICYSAGKSKNLYINQQKNCKSVSDVQKRRNNIDENIHKNQKFEKKRYKYFGKDTSNSGV